MEEVTFTITRGKAEKKFRAIHIPTATSDLQFVVADACEIYGIVAIALNGEVVGWKLPPNNCKEQIENKIKEAWDLPCV